ncbi:hypothetical protein BC940DRAFT_289234 [Gongronella butleri]|nr:hypothetical protein BC940DRAFT_289234 [Gongronella butleri]
MKSAQLLVTIGLLWVSQALAQGTGQNGATSAPVSPSASPTTPSAASSPSASPSDTPVPVPMPTPTPPSGTSPPCGDQVVFDQCLRNQDNYVKRCIPKDYACLCRWQQSKVSCYDNCPQDVNKETDVGIATHYCSQPGANA